MTGSVIVIGAGIIGSTTALVLQEAGWNVTLCDPNPPGGKEGASYGNGGWISPASIVPMSMPGLWRQVPGLLMDPDGPLTIDWTSLPRLAPWLIRFVLSGATEARVVRTAGLLNWLLHDGPERHLELAKQTGQEHLIVQNGLLYAYPDRQSFESEALAWRLRKENGVFFEEWDEEKLRCNLAALSADYRFAAYVPKGAHCRDTGAYVAGIVDTAVRAGVRVVSRGVRSISNAPRPRVTLEAGGGLDADYVVVAAGIHSRELMRGLGAKIPMTSERGYHVTMASADQPFDIPVMPSTGKMANTPTNMGLRVSGQVELAAIDKAPNWRRVEVLKRHALASYPYLNDTPHHDMTIWMGHRPSTPDGLPVIGRLARHQRIIAAFGHGHVGVGAAPKTAEMVLGAVKGRPAQEASDFLPARFGY